MPIISNRVKNIQEDYTDKKMSIVNDKIHKFYNINSDGGTS